MVNFGMLLFVDYEHADWYTTERGAKTQAARTWITYRLEDLSGQHCLLVRYDRVTPALVDQLDITAIFISGNGSDLDRYDPAALEPLATIVRESGRPLFGFCGGFQFLSDALGAKVVDIEVPADQRDSERLKQLPTGRDFEFGYHSVDLLGEHPLLTGLGPEPVFRHAHGLHVPNPPDGFEVLASTAITPVQLAVDDSRRIVGTQFHPEYWTDEHPAGKTLIANFLAWL